MTTTFDVVAEALRGPRLGVPIRIEGECWVWTAAQSHGYGMKKAGRMFLVHRVAYEAAVGPIPVGLTIYHRCRRTLCVNPAHLEPVTRSESKRRSPFGKFACVHGHSYLDPANVRRRADGRPVCLVCKREQARAAYAKDPAAVMERQRRYRAKQGARERKPVTACPQGHSMLDPANVYRYGSVRMCLTCRRRRSREWYERKRAKKQAAGAG